MIYRVKQSITVIVILIRSAFVICVPKSKSVVVSILELQNKQINVYLKKTISLIKTFKFFNCSYLHHLKILYCKSKDSGSELVFSSI